MPEVQYRLDAGSSQHTSDRANSLLQSASEIQLRFICEEDAVSRITEALCAILEFSQSSYGLIGAVFDTEDSTPRFQTLAAVNSTSHGLSPRDHHPLAADSVRLQALKDLSADTLRTGTTQITRVPPPVEINRTDPTNDSDEVGPLISIPLRIDGQLTGIVALGNRPGGYTSEVAQWLKPMLTTCEALIPRATRQPLNKTSDAQFPGDSRIRDGRDGPESTRDGADESSSNLDRLNTEEHWQTVVQNVSDSILIVGRQGQIRFINRIQDGYDQNSVLNSTVFDYQPADAHDNVRRALHRVFEHGESVTFETIGKGKPDEWRTYVCRVAPMDVSNSEPTALMIASDVTDERAARAAEARQFALLKAITEGTSELIFAKDLDSRPVFVNEATIRLHGRSRNELLGRSEESLFSRSSYEKIVADDQRIIRSGQSETFEEVLSHVSGELRLLTTKCPWRDQHGNVIGVIGIAQNITEWKETRDALRQNRERLRAIIEATPECVKLVARDGTLLEMNAAGLRMIEADTADCVVGKTTLDLISPEWRSEFLAFHQRVCNGTSGSIQYEIIGLKGSRRWLETHAVPLSLGPDEEIVHLAITRDITAAREAEEIIAGQQTQLQHVSRLSSMGQMVAVISHEITQPLAAISNYSSACALLARHIAPQNEKLMEYLTSINKQSVRAGQILSRIRNFVRRSDNHRTVCNLTQLVTDSLTLVQADLRSRGITVSTQLPNEEATVLADSVQIQQVIVNLISNASDAMSGQPASQRQIDVSVTVTRQWASVEILDNGPGLADGEHDQLFDPFYSSKNKGMGMGLTICNDIIRSHSGKITAENVQNHGARFRFCLPRPSEDTDD